MVYEIGDATTFIDDYWIAVCPTSTIFTFDVWVNHACTHSTILMDLADIFLSERATLKECATVEKIDRI